MEGQCKNPLTSTPRVKAILRLGAESFSVKTAEGILSEQLVAMKEEGMTILRNFITKDNIPNDFADEEPVESISEEDEGDNTVDNPPKKSKKQR